MVKEAGAEYVIIGHSERRTLFGETDAEREPEDRRRACRGALPIVCIGETLAEREAGETLSCSIGRSRPGSTASPASRSARWSSPTSRSGRSAPGRNGDGGAGAGSARAHPPAAAPVVRRAAADECHVIYGGSVKPDNTRDLIAQPDVDGALVGGASLDIKSFFEIVSRSR